MITDAFLKETFDGIETDSLPIASHFAAEDMTAQAWAYQSLGDFEPKILDFCQKNHVSEKAFLYAAYAFLLAQSLYEEESIFLAPYPIYIKIDFQMAVIELIRRMEALIAKMDSYSEAEIANLMQEFALHPGTCFLWAEDEFKPTPKELGQTLSLTVNRRNGDLEARIYFPLPKYSEGEALCLIHGYRQILIEMLHRQTLSQIEMASDAQIAVVNKYNQTEHPYDKRSIVDQFRAVAQANPNQTAIVFRDKRYTYKQVDEISEKIAAYIVSLGMHAEDVVSILIRRHEYMAIASLGVLKSGAAYQPLDPSYPEDRLSYMVADSGAKLLIVDDHLVNRLSGYHGKILKISEIANLPADHANITIEPNTLFTLLYTSGSTGKPKGVMLDHHNLSAFCAWFIQNYHLDSQARVAAYASYGFDANMMDMWPTLISGATLYVIDEAIRLDLGALDQYFSDNQITHAFMTTQVGRQFAEVTTSAYLKYLSVGGEKLVPVDPPKGFTLYNAYGPTECTIFITAFAVDQRYERVPIGHVLDNLKLYVVDKFNHLMPIGMPGMLCVAGHQVGRGYLNLPEKTAEAFIPNPFCQTPGYERIYKTGDIVRQLPDGAIDFIGRKDGQVKIRGFRIELSEIEMVIRQYPGIADAAVVDFTDPSGGKYIAAYIVSNETIDIDQLNHFIAERKPPYMVPAVTMQIDRIPLNQNQKVNKRALPVPEVTSFKKDIKAPSTEMQNDIFDIIAKITGMSQFGVEDDIFEIGITSITSMRLLLMLSKKYNVVLKSQDLNTCSTIEALEARIVSLQSQRDAENPIELQHDYPISQTQAGIFVECSAHPDETAYNLPFLFKLSPSIDLERLRQAWIDTIDAHYYVKTHLIVNQEGDIRAVRCDDSPANVEMTSRDNITDERALQHELLKPFKLLDAPLYRVQIIHTPAQNYLFIDFHHIICDGSSLVILFEDLNRRYDGQPIEKEEFSGFELAADEEIQRETKQYKDAKAYFNEQFKGLDTDYLPKKDYIKDKLPGSRSIKYTFELPVGDVEAWCQKHHLTRNAFFNAAFGLVLSKLNYKDDAVYTTIYHGRKDVRTDRAVSMLVKTLPVHCIIDYTKPIADYVSSVGRHLVGSMAHDIYSFAEISRAYHLKSEVMFVYQGDSFNFEQIGGCDAPQIPFDVDAQTFLSIDLFEIDGKFVFHADYRKDYYRDDTILRIAECVETAARNFICKAKLSEVEIVSQNQCDLIRSFNQTDVAIPDTTVDRLLLEQAHRHPDKLAVIDSSEQLTYKELNCRSNRVANALIAEGAKHDMFIGAMMPRIANAYVVREGIIKAGAAFMPIDPTYPDDRIIYMLENSNASLVVTTQAVAQARKDLFQSKGVKLLTVEELLLLDNDTEPNTEVQPHHLCYCLYTSGSTGKPKGVMIEHHNLVNYLQNDPLNPETYLYCKYMTVSISLAALTFDVSVLEEMIPLTHGATVVMASDDEILNPLLLSQTMIKHHVDAMTCTPSYINNMLDVPQVQAALKQLKFIDIGAEAFPALLYHKIREVGMTCEVHNSYGPSECTIGATMGPVTDDHITIGRPYGNTKIVMLDKQDHVMPIGFPGELTIIGSQVGRGYVARPELTQEKFIQFEGLPAYRSGDIARFNSDGNIEIFGRSDNQVKLHGLRIELDEISNVMNSYPGVLTSIVLVRENASHEQFLAGYFTASVPIDIAQLTEHLKGSLTAYMVPPVLIQLDAMPLTANGKIDKKALPEPEFNVEKRAIKQPVNELQRQLCQILAKALGLPEIGIDEDFFDLGGTSLAASKVAMAAMIHKIPIVYKDIFDYPTVEKLEAFIHAQSSPQPKEAPSAPATPSSYATPIAESAAQSFVLQRVLARNTSSHVDEIKAGELGDVLLTGATGFLGVHILKELIDSTNSTVYCLVRKGKFKDVSLRVKNMLMYYFDTTFDDIFESRIRCIEGDITDTKSLEQILSLPIKTVINSAACVKHFAASDILERINVGGVANLIDICERMKIRLIQISTYSIAGENVNQHVNPNQKLHENELYFGQSLENKYVNTKFRAEELVLSHIAQHGLDAKIIRVGNLMSRQRDGEFQINFVTNGFMRGLKGYAAIGMYPVSRMDETVEFSPIDTTAAAIVRLAPTNAKFTVFHAFNGHRVEMGDVIEAVNACGIPIQVVPDDVFDEAFQRALADESTNMLVSGLISYMSHDEDIYEIEGDPTFTIRALYRLGFKWPATDKAYLINAIEALRTLRFFDGDAK